MIKQVYFDVGGVVLIDFSGNHKWREFKKDLGVTSDNDKAFETLWECYGDRVCVDYDVDDLIPHYQQQLHLSFPKNYSMLEDFVSRFELNPSIWPIAHAVKEKYHIGLLTNMYPRMLDLIKLNKLIPDIVWDTEVDSSVVGYQKPDNQIYSVAEQLAGFSGDEILFVDNTLKNLEAAKVRGWQTLLYNPQDLEGSNQLIEETLQL